RRRRQHAAPGQGHAAAVLDRGAERAPHRGELVGAEQYRRGKRGHQHEQGRNLDQAAAADHRVDETGEEGEAAEGGEGESHVMAPSPGTGREPGATPDARLFAGVTGEWRGIAKATGPAPA